MIPAWHEYLLEHHFDRLWREGYRAFFLDTVDSYLIVTAKANNAKNRRRGWLRCLRR